MSSTPPLPLRQSLDRSSVRQFNIRDDDSGTLQLLQQLIHVKLKGATNVPSGELDTNLPFKYSYHYSFAQIDAQALKDAEFTEAYPGHKASVVTISLVPKQMQMENGIGVWLKHTEVDGEKNKTPWTLTFVFSVGVNNIVTGTAERETAQEAIDILKAVGFQCLPDISSWKKRIFLNHKKKYVRPQDGVECQVCVSQMGPMNYYQHASLKFPTEMEEQTRDIIAEGLRTNFQFVPGRSSVVECLRLCDPEAYQQIRELDYEGDIPKDCYALYNCFETDPSQDDYSNVDYRYIPFDLLNSKHFLEDIFE